MPKVKYPWYPKRRSSFEAILNAAEAQCILVDKDTYLSIEWRSNTPEIIWVYNGTEPYSEE